MRTRMMRGALTAIATLGSLAGCAAILGINPTDVIDANDAGNDGGIGANEGGTLADGRVITNEAGDDAGPKSVPPFDSTCASAITNIDPHGKEASAIVADGTAVFWATPFDASVGEIWMLKGGAITKIAGDDPTDSTMSEPSIVGLALDSTHLYWTSWDTYSTDNGPTYLRQWIRDGSNAINTADLSGMVKKGVSEIALANNHLFFGTWKSLSQNCQLGSIAVPFAQGAPATNLMGGLDSPLHFASDGIDAVYYDEAMTTGDPQNEVALTSARFGGGNEIDKTVTSVEDLVVGASSRVYWAQTQDSKIQSHLPLFDAGTEAFVSISYPHFLAYDSDHQMLYVITSSTGNVWSLHRFSTAIASPPDQLCVDNLNDASALQYFNGHVYFSATTDAKADGLFDLTVK